MEGKMKCGSQKSPLCSNEGLMIETSAFNLFAVASQFTLSIQLINPKFCVKQLI